MKKLLFLLISIAANVSAAVVPHEVILNQGNAAGTSYSIRYIAPPPSNSVMFYDLPTNLPTWLSATSFQADWSAVSGYGAILNKPSQFPAAPHAHVVSDVTGLQSQLDSKIAIGASIPYSILTGLPASFTPSAHTQAFSTITLTPTTRAGYGITDAEALGAASTAQSFAIQRANHAGTQSADTLTDGATNKSFLAAERTKLSGIAAGATANDTDANLKARANHIGTQLASTVSDFNSAADARVSAGITGKENTITAGTTAQYWRGDKTWQTLPLVAARTFSYQTRALNTCFQVSSTRDALVSYTVEVATSISLSGGSAGTVYLRTYTNSACSTGAQEITRLSNGQSGALTIGLSITQTVAINVSGIAPAGAWLQLVTENNTGTPTFTARPGQETLL